MARVTVTEPVNGHAIDATPMRQQLEHLATGINNVDATQLNDGSVTYSKIANGAVSLAQLKGGEFAYYGRLLKADGTEPAPGTIFYFDGLSGDDHQTKFNSDIFQAVSNAVWDWRIPGGTAPSLFSITPPQNCYIFLTGNIRMTFLADNTNRQLIWASCGLWVSEFGAVTDGGNHIAEVFTQEFNPPEQESTFGLNLNGLYPAVGGTTYTIRPALKFHCESAGTCTVRVYFDPKMAWIGAILLPR